MQYCNLLGEQLWIQPQGNETRMMFTWVHHTTPRLLSFKFSRVRTPHHHLDFCVFWTLRTSYVTIQSSPHTNYSLRAYSPYSFLIHRPFRRQQKSPQNEKGILKTKEKVVSSSWTTRNRHQESSKLLLASIIYKIKTKNIYLL